MTQEDAEPTVSEEVQETANATPALNREERRAQARGKKTGAAAGTPAVGGKANMRGPGGRGATAAGGTIFPRSGHK